MPCWPKAIDWMSESKVSITWARAWSSNSTTCRASGQVTAHRLPFAVERQARDAQVLVAAVLRERVGRRVEDLDALAGRDVDLVASWGRRPGPA